MSHTGPPLPESGAVFHFRRVNGQWEHFDLEAARDAWLASGDSTPQPHSDMDVTATVFLTDAGMAVGRVEVETIRNPEPGRLVSLGENHYPIDSAAWRSIPIGRLLADVLQSRPELHRWALERSGLAPEDWPQSDEWIKSAPQARQGLTYEVLEGLVAPAYLSGGTRGGVAVRKALQAAGYPGSGPNGDVTADQARQAIRKARQTISQRTGEPLIPPAQRRGSNDE